MIFDSKREAIEYIKKILDMGMVVDFYRLKTLFEKNQIKINNLKLIEIRGGEELSLVSIDTIYRDVSVDLTLQSESFMKFLPLLYHDKDFLKRYLFGMQSSLLPIDEMIFNISDEFTAQNSHHIDWLSSWFGIRYGDIIDEKAKRRVVANAVELYQTRGTKEYYKKLIKSLVDIDIEIDDNIYSLLNRDKSTKKQRAFTVIIDKKISSNEKEENRVYSIIKSVFEKEKPVNTKLYIKYDHITNSKEETSSYLKESYKEEVISFKADIKISDNDDYDDYDY